MPFLRELDTVVGHHLVDVTVLVTFRLRVADENDQSWLNHLVYTLVRANMSIGGLVMKQIM